MRQVARRLLAAIKRRRRLLLICAVGMLVIFAATAYLAHRYPKRISFGSFRELHGNIEAANDLSRAAYYRGDKDGCSYFYHYYDLFPNLELEIPADAWKHSPRFPYTHDRKQWVSWREIEEEGGLGGKGARLAREAKSAERLKKPPSP